MKTTIDLTQKQEALKKLSELKKQIQEQEALIDSLTEKTVSERIKNYQDICDELGVSSGKESISINVEGFDDVKNLVAEAFIKAMRISEVYRQGRLPKKGENRYYAWGELSSSSPSGLVFDAASGDGGSAFAASAAHLSFFSSDDAKDAFMKFTDVYAVLFGAKLILG